MNGGAVAIVESGPPSRRELGTAHPVIPRQPGALTALNRDARASAAAPGRLLSDPSAPFGGRIHQDGDRVRGGYSAYAAATGLAWKTRHAELVPRLEIRDPAMPSRLGASACVARGRGGAR